LKPVNLHVVKVNYVTHM